jgi:hypothetical protein
MLFRDTIVVQSDSSTKHLGCDVTVFHSPRFQRTLLPPSSEQHSTALKIKLAVSP